VPDFDLLIIGGGINGLGTAVEAALRGLRVLLVEREDFGAGTTGASSRLIHGGLRYLRHGELGLVRESLAERGRLARARPHLVRPIRLTVPVYRGIPPPDWQLRVGLALYNRLASDPLFPAAGPLGREQLAAAEPGLAQEGLIGAHQYPDAQIEFPERLCVELLLEFRAAGGEALNHTAVTRLTTAGRRVTGAELRDGLTGREWAVTASLTVNAAGPWVDAVNALLPEPPPRLLGGTWGTHLVLPARPGGPRGPIYAPAQRDGRPLFFLPWDGRLLVGTTDVRAPADPDAVRTADWEVEYLLAEAARLFPGAGYTTADVQYTTVGVRPLPLSRARPGAVTRRHFLVDHERRHGRAGLASLVGGKLTTYRSLAESAVDWCQRRLGRPVTASRTRAPRGMPGPVGTDRLSRLYADPAQVRAAGPAEPLAPGSPATVAEARHAIRTEGARTVEDVLLRRLMRLPPTPEERAAVAELLR
jgi:glycerol-3-phosphate dehydrogenase